MRRRFLPSYHYEDNTDGVLIDSVGKPLRGYRIYGAEGGVGQGGTNLCPYEGMQVVKTSTWAYGNLGKILLPGVAYYTMSIKFVQNITGRKVALSIRDYDSTSTNYKEATSTAASGTLTVQFRPNDGSKGIQVLLYSNSSSTAQESDATFSEAMLVKGWIDASEMPEYEPYGVSLPIEVGGTGGTVSYSIALPDKLYAGDYIDYKSRSIVIGGEATAAELPELATYKGSTNVVVNTDVVPEVVWQYYRE